jgi:hypothetical protein
VDAFNPFPEPEAGLFSAQHLILTDNNYTITSFSNDHSGFISVL